MKQPRSKRKHGGKRGIKRESAGNSIKGTEEIEKKKYILQVRMWNSL